MDAPSRGTPALRASSILLASLFTGLAMAQLKTASPASAGVSAERLEQAAQLIRTQVDSGAVRAAAVLVARDGRIVLQKQFGKLSSTPDAPPVTPDSVFLVASITKPVTVASLMLLVERGLVSLNDPVNRYLPQFTGGDRDTLHGDMVKVYEAARDVGIQKIAFMTENQNTK